MVHVKITKIQNYIETNSVEETTAVKLTWQDKLYTLITSWRSQVQQIGHSKTLINSNR